MAIKHTAEKILLQKAVRWFKKFCAGGNEHCVDLITLTKDTNLDFNSDNIDSDMSPLSTPLRQCNGAPVRLQQGELLA